MERIKMVNGEAELVNEKGMTEAEFLDWYKKEEKDKYEKPSVTTDMLIFTVADKQQKKNNRKIPEKELKVLLIKRKDHPYIGKWAIPGGFMNMKEDLEVTAERELKEETNVENIYMEQLYTWGDVNRDPRMRVVSTSYMALVDSSQLNVKAGDDAEEAKWFSIKKTELEESTEKVGNKGRITQLVEIEMNSDDGEDRIVYKLKIDTTIEGANSKTEVKVQPSVLNTDNLAFDHIKIVNYGLDRLQNKLEYTPIAFNLMPEYFTLTELQMVYETILGRKLLKANFRRKILPMVIETEKVKGDSAYRPSKLFTFNPEWVLKTF